MYYTFLSGILCILPGAKFVYVRTLCCNMFYTWHIFNLPSLHAYTQMQYIDSRSLHIIIAFTLHKEHEVKPDTLCLCLTFMVRIRLYVSLPCVLWTSPQHNLNILATADRIRPGVRLHRSQPDVYVQVYDRTLHVGWLEPADYSIDVITRATMKNLV